MTDLIDELSPGERCANCGVALREDENVFAIDDELVVCFDCALARGGSWDAAGQCWAKAPQVDDLVERDRPDQTHRHVP
jgi:hypothetical protein